MFEAFPPLGYVDSGPSSAQSAHYQALRDRLSIFPEPFSGNQIHSFFTFSPPSNIPTDMRRIAAIWSGTPQSAPNQMITIEMPPSLRLELGTILDPDTPVPTRATYGPVELSISANDATLEGGQEIGQLWGSTFAISLQDQAGFYLDPIACFELFQRLDLWRLPDNVRLPLLYPSDLNIPVSVAGPEPASVDQPYLAVSGGSHAATVQNPPDVIDSSYFSFLSSDTIHISVRNPPQAGGASLQITDITDPSYRSQVVTPPVVNANLSGDYQFIPQNVLRPHHLPYATANGKRQPGAPLTYRIRVEFGNGTPPLETTIQQDLKDIIRQEYLFHSAPFQTGSIVLEIPERNQLERNIAPAFSRHFEPDDVQWSNYGRGNGNIMLNGGELYKVAEYMRSRFAVHLADVYANNPGSLHSSVVTYDLQVNSSWRNPERNEAVNGARRSNHQFGQAVDLKSVHRGHVNNNSWNVPLQVALFDAGRDFLEALITLNTAAATTNVEVLLERNSQLLWSYRAQANGSIRSRAGNRYNTVVGSAPPSDTAQAIRLAAARATHVHIGWPPAGNVDSLTLPEPAPYASITPTPEVYRSVILVAVEDDSVPQNDRIPINHAAESIKAYLESIDPQVPVEIREVSTAFEWLQYCNAFREPQFRMRYFFSLSHAWTGGLVLNRFSDDIPYIADDGGPQIHVPEEHERLTLLYGYEEDDDDFDFTDIDPMGGVVMLATGSDDYTTIKTNQLRISNLLWLQPSAKRRMRQTFEHASGVYILGCRTADQTPVPRPNFCQALANTIDHPVFGAAYYSKFFSPDDDGEWQPRDILRSDPAPDHQPLVLVPGAYGTGQLVQYLWDEWRAPDIPDFPETSGLLDVFEHFLTRCDPEVF